MTQASPVVTGADYYAVPVGQTFTLTGTGLGKVTGAKMMWSRFLEEAAFTIVNDTTLEVVMPNFQQASRDYLMVLEGSEGSTVLIPPVFREVTSQGVNTVSPFVGPTVVRAGGRLEDSIPFSSTVIETGGVLAVVIQGTIIAEEGAVVDFTGVTTTSPNSRLFYSPGTVIIGEIPPGMTATELTSIETSHGTGLFTEGFEIEVTVVGGGEVTRSPDQLYYDRDTEVTLTAVAGKGQIFSEWSGSTTSAVNPLTPAPFGKITATFLGGRRLEIFEVPGVSVVTTPEGDLFPTGTEVTLEATVQPGYEFLGWAGGASGGGQVTSVTLDQDLKVLPVVRAIPAEPGPQVTGVDYAAVPYGANMRLSGTALSGVSAAKMLSRRDQFDTTVQVIDEQTIEVTMPVLRQGAREHFLFLEGGNGSTIILPPEVIEVTVEGIPANQIPSGPFLVRAGGNLSEFAFSPTVVVQAGGMVSGNLAGNFFAENGSVIDLTEVSFGSGISLFLSPDAIVLGEVPPGMEVFEVPPIRVSEGVTTFSQGYELIVNTVGVGQVMVSPDQRYFAGDALMTLTAVPGEGQLFSGWSGAVTSMENPVTGSFQGEVTASFSEGWAVTSYEIPGVTLQVTPDLSVHAPGSSVTLEAVLEPGYEFLQWAGDASGTEQAISVEMTADRLVFPVVRKIFAQPGPQVTGVNRFVMPPGETATLTGSNLEGISTAFLFWGSENVETTATPVDGGGLEVMMPELRQGAREHVLLLKGEAGSTVVLPPEVVEVTAGGATGNWGPGVPTIVRAGGKITGESGFFSSTIVETGGVLVAGQGVIVAENGAVLDFRGSTSSLRSVLFRSPETVILGDLPEHMEVYELSAIEASFGLGTFTVGYPLNLRIEGPGTVTVSPQKEFYGAAEQVTLEATPSEGAFFIRWIGLREARESTVTTGVGGGEIVARFSTAPDFFNTWRPLHFTDEELGDLSVSSLEADPDNDSISNAAEYALGSDPRKADAGQGITVEFLKVDGVPRLFARYFRPKDALDVEYLVLVSTDNQNWSSNADDPDVVVSVETGSEAVGENLERVTVEIFPGQDPPGSLFVRIGASLFQ